MSSYLKVQERSDLVRDSNSKAVLNIDNNGLLSYRKRREKDNKINEMITEFNSMRVDISEIKMLFKQLLEKK